MLATRGDAGTAVCTQCDDRPDLMHLAFANIGSHADARQHICLQNSINYTGTCEADLLFSDL